VRLGEKTSSDSQSESRRLYFWVAEVILYAVWLEIFRLFGLGLFVPNAFAFMFVGRYAGWAISRNLLFRMPLVGVAAGCLVWGFLVAFGMSLLIRVFQPGEIVRWIMGYALGCYVAIPHFGLLAADSDWKHNNLATVVPFLAFVAASIALS
jgi:hypothetical protein